MSHDLADLALRFIRAVESGATGEALAAFYHPDVVAIEHPNRLAPNGAKRNLNDLLTAAERGQAAMRSQTYEILSVTAQENRVVVETIWTGVLAISVGSLSPGDAMRAHFAIVLDYQDGKIIGSRNYDCFEPF